MLIHNSTSIEKIGTSLHICTRSSLTTSNYIDNQRIQQGGSIPACAIVQSDRSLCCVLCCKLNRRGRGSDIFLISARNIDVGESQGGSQTWLFSQHFILVAILTL